MEEVRYVPAQGPNVLDNTQEPGQALDVVDGE